MTTEQDKYWDKYWKAYKKNVKVLAKQLGYGVLYSYDDLFNGGTINAFGTKTNSAPTLHVVSNTEDKVVRIDINTKYFSLTPTVTKLNKQLRIDPMTLVDCIQWVNVN